MIEIYISHKNAYGHLDITAYRAINNIIYLDNEKEKRSKENEKKNSKKTNRNIK